MDVTMIVDCLIIVVIGAPEALAARSLRPAVRPRAGRRIGIPAEHRLACSLHLADGVLLIAPAASDAAGC